MLEFVVIVNRRKIAENEKNEGKNGASQSQGNKFFPSLLSLI